MNTFKGKFVPRKATGVTAYKCCSQTLGLGRCKSHQPECTTCLFECDLEKAVNPELFNEWRSLGRPMQNDQQVL